MSLKEQMNSDLSSVFFKAEEGLEEFAETFVYRPASGAGHYEVVGIFDASTQVAPSGGSSKIETKFIRIMVRESDIRDGVRTRDQLVVRQKLYGMAAPPESDGVGVLTLTLEEISDAPTA